MNAIEQRISTTFAPGILAEIREELNALKGKISQKNWDRMNGKLRARSRSLARGVEETIAEPTDLPPAKVRSLGKEKRKVKWIQITRKDASGRIWLDGWRRPKGSRKENKWKKLKEPQLLFDPAKVPKKAKKRGKKKKETI